MKQGNIPIIYVSGKSLAGAWEKAVIKIWEEGIELKTEYDKKEDPASRDATLIMVVEEPLSEPRIHRAFPAGLEELEVYRQEVVLGVHDHWINPDEGKWTYTYHKRLFEYEMEQQTIDQIQYIIDKLSQKYYSRRAQAITWNPKLDPPTDDPPCLQRLWCRLSLVAGDEPRYVLNMNSHWRSRDIYKAAFMNIFALTDLQRVIAVRLSKRIGHPVEVGRYVDMTDSAHIYGSYFKEFKHFLDTVRSRSFEERTWSSEFAEPMFEEAREKIKKEQAAF